MATFLHSIFLKSRNHLVVELHVVVPRPLHPERLHRPRALLVDGEAVGEVDHLVLSAVDHQDGGGHAGDLKGDFQM